MLLGLSDDVKQFNNETKKIMKKVYTDFSLKWHSDKAPTDLDAEFRKKMSKAWQSIQEFHQHLQALATS